MKRLKVVLICLAMALFIDVVGFLLDWALGANLKLVLFIWGLSTIPIALILYSLRRAHRLYYGSLELIVAIGLLYFLILNMVFGEQPKDISLVLLVNRILTIFAVVYFMVRALDNIGEGLKPGSALQARWDSLFPKA